MNREAESAAKSLSEQLRSITNEALWDYESDAIEAAADALAEAEGLIAYLKGEGREHGAWDQMKTELDQAREQVANAPHQYMVCQTYNDGDCTCWKSATANATL